MNNSDQLDQHMGSSNRDEIYVPPARAERINATNVRSIVWKALRFISTELGIDVSAYHGRLREYILQPDHAFIRPTLMELTNDVVTIIPEIGNSKQYTLEVVNTVVAAMEAYHTPARRAEMER